MKTKFGTTVLVGAFLAALVIPSTVLAGGGGGGRGGGGAGGMSGMSGMSGMGGASIRNQTQMQNNSQTREMDQLRVQDRERIHKVSGTGSAAAATGSAVSATGEKPKKGNTYGSGDGTGPYLPKDGTGYGAPANR